MRDQILKFNKQLEFKPEIKNRRDLKFKSYIVCGMGGSHLASDFLAGLYQDDFGIKTINDYHIPQNISSDTCTILSSFSGNTEETLSCYQEIISRKLEYIVIASGGKLLDMAIQNNSPYIALPQIAIQPRMAFGYSLMAFAKAMSVQLNTTISDPSESEAQGKQYAQIIGNKIPLFYSDTKHEFLAKHWKIKFNETAKVPAFFNVLPEMNHNEINMFQRYSRENQSPFIAIFLKSGNISPVISKRIRIMQDILETYGTAYIDINFSNILDNIVLSDWASYYLAVNSGIDPETIPIIDELKSELKT